MAGSKTITQRIAFEGGDQMELQLRNLGEAGATAFKRLQDAADNASGFGARLTTAIEAVKTKLEALSVSASNVGEKFSNLGSKVESSAKSFLYTSAAVTGAAYAFVTWIDKAAIAARESEDLASVLNITTEQLNGLQFAAAQFGISGDDFAKGLGRIGKQVETTNKQNIQYNLSLQKLTDQYLKGKISSDAYLQGQQDLNKSTLVQTNIFQRLGIATVTYGGQARNTLDIMYDLADAFKNTNDQNARFAISTEFSRAGMSKFIPFLNQGADAIKRIALEGQRIAPAFTETQKAVGLNFSVALNNLKLAADRAQQSLALLFAPEFTALAKALTEAIVQNRDKLLLLGQYVAGQLRPIIADIITLLQGGTLSKESFVEQMRVAIVAFVKDAVAAVKILIGAWNGFVDVLQYVANVINNVFGTHLDGRILAIVAIVGTLSGAFGILFAAISAGAAVVGFLVTAFGGLEVAIAAGGFALGFGLVKLLQSLPDIATAAWKALVDGFTGTVANFATLFKLIGAAWELLWKSAGDFAKSVLDSVVGWLEGLIEKIKSAVSAITGLGGGNSSDQAAQGYAGGGAVRGPGGPRTDSIWARLSNGEFVQRAAAVQHYGVDFMHAINNLRLPRLGGFADGGLVKAISGFVPRFADGGLAQFATVPIAGNGGGRPFTLNIGGEQFTGMTAEDATFDKLQRYAVRKTIQSSGRKPLWVS